MAAPDLLEHIDRIMAELAELRAGVAGAAADNEKGMESGRSAQERVAEHFIRCPACGGWIDCRDLGQVFEHEGPLPHPLQDQPQ